MPSFRPTTLKGWHTVIIGHFGSLKLYSCPSAGLWGWAWVEGSQPAGLLSSPNTPRLNRFGSYSRPCEAVGPGGCAVRPGGCAVALHPGSCAVLWAARVSRLQTRERHLRVTLKARSTSFPQLACPSRSARLSAAPPMPERAMRPDSAGMSPLMRVRSAARPQRARC